ncbi:MAG: TolC family outer membrane protein [Gammaproteobacteria bacterium]|nr:TolC family outer membrane protein [Gammaproteobacteria bacterium]NIO65711.1 TolC family outer membrane protein [Gammaproteobacteria bacterium]NIP45835.1 TolC family outer membrane protein [Gammaproteobacteria bacterium]NIP64600.1 TolC family outer membrane protein [Gammaproteobacteria bacterium]NIP88049.1 TolC family outer membrane protein [Gammaproteobacteria bacterium]
MQKRNTHTMLHSERLSFIAGLVLAVQAGAACAATSLIELFEISQEADPEYQSAVAANQAAQELTPQARSFLLPNLSAGGEVRHNWSDVQKSGQAAAEGNIDWGDQRADISITQPVYRQDLWVQLEQADLRTRQANAEFAFARQELILRISVRYFDVLRARDQLAFAKAALEAFGQQLKQAQQRFEVGLIAITDVEEAQSGFDLATADVIAAENDLDNAREALREVTGLYTTDLASLGDGMPLVTPQPADINQWTETALRQNLQITAARHAAATAKEEIDRIRAGHLPTLDLVGRAQYFNTDGGFTFNSRTVDGQVGLQLNVPIYEGGLVVSQTRESEHLYQQSLDDLERQRRAVQRQARAAYQNLESDISRVKALVQAVKSTVSAKEAIDAGFQVGTRTSVDVLNAERRVFEARRDLAFSRYDYIINRLTLKQAAGTLSEADVEQVNGWLIP